MLAVMAIDSHQFFFNLPKNIAESWQLEPLFGELTVSVSLLDQGSSRSISAPAAFFLSQIAKYNFSC
jgi:hypothetical protein